MNVSSSHEFNKFGFDTVLATESSPFDLLGLLTDRLWCLKIECLHECLLDRQINYDAVWLNYLFSSFFSSLPPLVSRHHRDKFLNKYFERVDRKNFPRRTVIFFCKVNLWPFHHLVRIRSPMEKVWIACFSKSLPFHQYELWGRNKFYIPLILIMFLPKFTSTRLLALLLFQSSLPTYSITIASSF